MTFEWPSRYSRFMNPDYEEEEGFLTPEELEEFFTKLEFHYQDYAEE